MTYTMLPAIWLIVFIVGLPQLSETVYTPSLPDIARMLEVSESMVEYTLTIYLFSFALGTLFWGILSDKIGRKPCIIYGLIIFIIGCIVCYFSYSIATLMTGRFIQAFGGSIGSVLGQTVCRDSFQGIELGKVYSTIGSALALFPAIGPVIGGVISERYGWQPIFLFLILVALVLILLTCIKLPETHKAFNRSKTSVILVAKTMITDFSVIGFGIIVAICNGISFSYFAEGSFCLIENLGLIPSYYGLSFIAIAFATFIGGVISRQMQHHYNPKVIMLYGIYTVIISTMLLSVLVLVNHYFMKLQDNLMIAVIILSQMANMLGICMTTSNALALALVRYKNCIGVASSFFGLFYYFVIAIITLGMGLLHNGTLIAMPIYFLVLSLSMLIVKHIFIFRN